MLGPAACLPSGPWYVGEVMTDVYGLVFAHGVVVTGHFLPGSMTYLNGIIMVGRAVGYRPHPLSHSLFTSLTPHTAGGLPHSHLLLPVPPPCPAHLQRKWVWSTTPLPLGPPILLFLGAPVWGDTHLLCLWYSCHGDKSRNHMASHSLPCTGFPCTQNSIPASTLDCSGCDGSACWRSFAGGVCNDILCTWTI